MKNILFLLSVCFIIPACSNKFKEVKNKESDYIIIPIVKSLEIRSGRFNIDENTQIYGDSTLYMEGNYLAELLSVTSGNEIRFTNNASGNIRLKLDSTFSSLEGYSVLVEYDKVEVTAKTTKGIFYGIQTIRQLLPLAVETKQTDTELTIPATFIEDEPRFKYRGMHLDVARHFFSVDFVKRYIDILALHKMNTFHWHLTEDQGWRIEIKKYPKLTEVGAWRNGTIVGNYPGTENDNKKHGGYYTQSEIKEIVAYAKEKHITVIPEIELPGHSCSAIAAYPSLSCFPTEPSLVPNDMMSNASKKAQENGSPKIVQESWGVYDDVYCAGKEETFEFLENVLSEVMELFPSEYIHIGGDECPKGNWKKCVNCQSRMAENELKDEHELQSYFINRIEKFVNSKGKNIIGWDEILEGGLAPNATVMSWRGTEGGIEASRANHQVIMTPNGNCYFDHYQTKDIENEPIAIGGFLPVEKVYGFEPIPEELEKDKQKYILGAQANLWSEYIPTEDYAEYMLLPRMTALSEVLWSDKEVKDWSEFKVRLNYFKQRFDALGYTYAKHVFKDDKK